MELNKGFYKTEIGLIPKDWEIKEISQVADVKSGKRLPLGNNLTTKATPHPYIRVADMLPGGVSLANIMYVPNKVVRAIKNYRIYKEDIFISVAGTLGIVGKIPEILNGANLTENADRFCNIKCHRDYLLFILMSPMIQNKIESEKTLGAQPKLALTRIRKFKVPFPPTKAEQTAIATALSDTDALITSLEKLIVKKRNIKQGAMQELLKPKKGWKFVTLGENATLKARIGWQGLTTEEYKESGEYALITGTEFRNGFIDWGNCHFVEYLRYSQDKNIQVRQGDVLVTKDGTIGKVAFLKEVPIPATLNSGVFVIRPLYNSFYPEFLYYILMSEYFKLYLSQLTAGSTISHLYQKDFIHFKFLAPTYQEQIEITSVLSEMDSEIMTLESKLNKCKNFKLGMMQNLLTGKIRLV